MIKKSIILLNNKNSVEQNDNQLVQTQFGGRKCAVHHKEMCTISKVPLQGQIQRCDHRNAELLSAACAEVAPSCRLVHLLVQVLVEVSLLHQCVYLRESRKVGKSWRRVG